MISERAKNASSFVLAKGFRLNSYYLYRKKEDIFHPVYYFIRFSTLTQNISTNILTIIKIIIIIQIMLQRVNTLI